MWLVLRRWLRALDRMLLCDWRSTVSEVSLYLEKGLRDTGNLL